jgi:hypothetical protein
MTATPGTPGWPDPTTGPNQPKTEGREGMTDSPHPGGLSTSRGKPPGNGAHTPNPDPTTGSSTTTLLRPEQRAPRGVDVKDLRPLRGRPFGPIPDPDASLGAAQQQAKRTARKIHRQEQRVDRPRPFRDDCQSGPISPLMPCKGRGLRSS